MVEKEVQVDELQRLLAGMEKVGAPKPGGGLVGLAELPGPALLGRERESLVVMSLAVLSADPAEGLGPAAGYPPYGGFDFPTRSNPKAWGKASCWERPKIDCC